ncbi:MAG: PEP/pyruvate-binding domain-containing protein [Halobacteriota archaeon]
MILNPTPDSLPDDLETAYDRLGRGRVAVRSSASDEDGTAVSFAGQHATVLDVEGGGARSATPSSSASAPSPPNGRRPTAGSALTADTQR